MLRRSEKERTKKPRSTPKPSTPAVRKDEDDMAWQPLERAAMHFFCSRGMTWTRASWFLYTRFPTIRPRTTDEMKAELIASGSRAYNERTKEWNLLEADRYCSRILPQWREREELKRTCVFSEIEIDQLIEAEEFNYIVESSTLAKSPNGDPVYLNPAVIQADESQGRRPSIRSPVGVSPLPFTTVGESLWPGMTATTGPVSRPTNLGATSDPSKQIRSAAGSSSNRHMLPHGLSRQAIQSSEATGRLGYQSETSSSPADPSYTVQDQSPGDEYQEPKPRRRHITVNRSPPSREHSQERQAYDTSVSKGGSRHAEDISQQYGGDEGAFGTRSMKVSLSSDEGSVDAHSGIPGGFTGSVGVFYQSQYQLSLGLQAQGHHLQQQQSSRSLKRTHAHVSDQLEFAEPSGHGVEPMPLFDYGQNRSFDALDDTYRSPAMQKKVKATRERNEAKEREWHDAVKAREIDRQSKQAKETAEKNWKKEASKAESARRAAEYRVEKFERKEKERADKAAKEKKAEEDSWLARDWLQAQKVEKEAKKKAKKEAKEKDQKLYEMARDRDRASRG